MAQQKNWQRAGTGISETADEILREAEKTWGHYRQKDPVSLLIMISFAGTYLRNHEQISNPLTDDIKVLFTANSRWRRC